MTDQKYIYKPNDFKSDQEVKWCPGCGNYAILSSVTRAFPEVAARKGYKAEDFAVISGIGCSSRFPYYVSTYGFHGIHGRSLAIATGTKVANPKLSVWVTTGDGDSLAIGGNHFIHAVRRNIDMNIILFNNEIYGLTKGQYSPTSELGKTTITSPFGTIEEPFSPGQLVIGAHGSFFARSVDMEAELTKDCLIAAADHKGTSVVEVLQNCVIFNDKTFAKFAGSKELRAENTIVLKHGQKMLFGKENERGLVMENMELKVVTLGENGVKESDILVHDAKNPNPTIQSMLANMAFPEHPVALGVIRSSGDQTYNDRMDRQIEEVQAKASIKTVDDLLHSGNTWEVA